eukprot:CAMPEP_0197902620 /NCGR_PEP_ID=MMETSP1439-20131203/53942_1 /TAXON_ID=66791 /ORGANISM="Gonyaulax spinifera, Strain CCMP409" /LENGTH=78 /DNA_ID=CAMNT_0043523665 /DNA_START=1 /DNA_END=237 /DNA_ORIENTATION=+
MEPERPGTERAGKAHRAHDEGSWPVGFSDAALGHGQQRGKKCRQLQGPCRPQFGASAGTAKMIRALCQRCMQNAARDV